MTAAAATPKGFLDTPAVYARLKAIRQARKMSVQDLADAGGTFTRSAWANGESGRRENLPYDELITVCGVLGVDPRIVISDDPMPFTTQVWVI